jgi:hypothetical protein
MRSAMDWQFGLETSITTPKLRSLTLRWSGDRSARYGHFPARGRVVLATAGQVDGVQPPTAVPVAPRRWQEQLQVAEPDESVDHGERRFFRRRLLKSLTPPAAVPSSERRFRRTSLWLYRPSSMPGGCGAGDGTARTRRGSSPVSSFRRKQPWIWTAGWHRYSVRGHHVLASVQSAPNTTAAESSVARHRRANILGDPESARSA